MAPSPLENEKPCAPPSSAARHASRALRVGLPLREYSKPLWLPGPSCAKVLARTMGVITAPLTGSGRLTGVDGEGVERESGEGGVFAHGPRYSPARARFR